MTNGELIAFLQRFPKDIPIYIDVGGVDDAMVTHFTKDDLVEEAIIFEQMGCGKKGFNEI